jgi:acyl carrier protein
MEIAKVDANLRVRRMTIEDCRKKIHQHILEKFPLAKKRNLRSGDPLLETGVLDSLGILDLVHYLEAEFGFQVTDEDLLPENFASTDVIARFVVSKASDGEK